MKTVLLFGLLFVVSLSTACNRDTDRTEAAAEPAMTDNQLQDKVDIKIKADPQLAPDVSVDADAERNSVTLTGTVESEGLRNRAVELARSAHGGVIVEDKIDVKPRELTREQYTEEHAKVERDRAREYKDTIGSSIDDAWIHAKLVTKLVGDSDTPARKINVDVNNNVVTLRGTVDTAEEKTEAERLAKETDGVKRVSNQLKVEKPKTS